MTAIATEHAARLHAVLVAMCRAVGLDPTGAQLLKYTMNAVYLLPVADVVARIRVGPVTADQGEQLVRLARWLATEDAPVTRLAPAVPVQPVLRDGYAATFWTALPAPDREFTGADLAEPLRALHRLSAPDWLAPWDPFATVRRWLAAADGLDDGWRAWLTKRCHDLEAAYRLVGTGLPTGLIHADAHTGNLLRGHDGRVVLCDIDTAARGPLDWDLVPSAVATRFGRPDRHASFAARYGRDVTRTAAWPVLRRIRELLMVTGVLPDLRRRPAVAAQLAYRLRTLRDGDDEAVWTRFE